MVLVHRLLKNRVVEATGVEAYLLATAPAMARLPTLGFTPHHETYEHLGRVELGVRDLAARYAEMQREDRAAVGPDELLWEMCYTVPAPIEVAWDCHIDGDKRAQWDGAADRWTLQPDRAGRTGAGAVVHCAHGADTATLRITGWRPYESMTLLNPAEGLRPEIRLTYAFEPAPGGDTRVTVRLGRPRGVLGRPVGWVLKRAFGRTATASVPILTRLLGGPALA